MLAGPRKNDGLGSYSLLLKIEQMFYFTSIHATTARVAILKFSGNPISVVKFEYSNKIHQAVFGLGKVLTEGPTDSHWMSGTLFPFVCPIK
jgi:hypothetical protein